VRGGKELSTIEKLRGRSKRTYSKRHQTRSYVQIGHTVVLPSQGKNPERYIRPMISESQRYRYFRAW
jgi:hypothetical protein